MVFSSQVEQALPQLVAGPLEAPAHGREPPGPRRSAGTQRRGGRGPVGTSAPCWASNSN